MHYRRLNIGLIFALLRWRLFIYSGLRYAGRSIARDSIGSQTGSFERQCTLSQRQNAR
jgi:hypothetical protein